MPTRRPRGSRESSKPKRGRPSDDGRPKPRNPLVPALRRLGHKAHEKRRDYKRHPKHKGRPPE